jgi:hypothetical protein
MPSYPTAPQSFVLTWENPLSLKQNPAINADRRKGGTEARGTNFQLNLTKETQEAKVIAVTRDDYEEVEEFLTGRNGKPFNFNSQLWSCLEWTWVFKGGDIFELSLSLKQEFRA